MFLRREVAYIYEIYLDVLLVNNFLMNLLDLFLTGIFMRNTIKWGRLVTASLTGSAAAVTGFLVLPSYQMYRLLLYLLLPPGMVLLAFGKKMERKTGITFLWKNSGTCFLFALLTGGCMQWINKSLFYGSHFYLAMLVTAGISAVTAMIWRHRKERGRNLYRVQIFYREHEIETEAYYDTGNLLMDPYVKRPVSIVDRNLFEPLLGKEEPVVRLIPFSSMGKESGLVEALTVEKIYIKEGKKEWQIPQAVIALGNPGLFQKKEYQMILNCHLL